VERLAQGGLIVALSIAAAVGYGIAHDMVTAHVCVEYFTIGHPPLIESQSPVVLALFWGVVATWWVGLPLGVMLASAAQIGSWPTIPARRMMKPVAVLLAVMAVCALLAGITGAVLAANGNAWLNPPLSEAVPKDRHVAFLADGWAHGASYLAGALGGLVLTVLTLLRRARMAPRIS
jgi:hypothetical protein